MFQSCYDRGNIWNYQLNFSSHYHGERCGRPRWWKIGLAFLQTVCAMKVSSTKCSTWHPLQPPRESRSLHSVILVFLLSALHFLHTATVGSGLWNVDTLTELENNDKSGVDMILSLPPLPSHTTITTTIATQTEDRGIKYRWVRLVLYIAVIRGSCWLERTTTGFECHNRSRTGWPVGAMRNIAFTNGVEEIMCSAGYCMQMALLVSKSIATAMCDFCLLTTHLHET